MPNNQNAASGAGSSSNQSAAAMSNSPAKSGGLSKEGKDQSKTQGFGDQEGGTTLEQLTSFIQANWKQVLSELVTTGVTAYLTHNAKEKSAKN